MTNLVQRLRNERISPATILRAVLNDFGKAPLDYFCFFEGKDATYYDLRVRSIILHNSRKYNCQGKGNLRQIYLSVKLNQSLSSIRCIFFFDRDYDDNIDDLDERNCFITPTYAVENFYTSYSTVRRIVEHGFFQDKIYDSTREKCLETVLDMYVRLQESYHQSILLFNCWAFAHRKLKNCESRIRLTRFDKEVNLFTVNMYEIRACYDLTQLNAAFCSWPPVVDSEIAAAEAWFRAQNFQKCFRGKQEIQFLSKFLSLLIELGAKGEAPFSEKVVCSIRNSVEHMVSDLSTFADTPVELQTFLRRFISSTEIHADSHHVLE